MAQLTVVNHVSLDGVMQAPGRPDEDPRGGFIHGGWAQAGNDPVMGTVMAEGMGRGNALLLGRRTYEDFAGYWPRQTDNPFTPVLDATRKYVASRTLQPTWTNAQLLPGELIGAVRQLKAAGGPDLTVLGSGQVAAQLGAAGLVDGYQFVIIPVALGAGRTVFTAGRQLRLVAQRAFRCGNVVVTYGT